MSSTILYYVPREVQEELLSTPTSWLTTSRIKMMNDMSAILAGVSLLFCMIVLGFIAVLYINKESRKTLDRVSFRLICYSLISNCFYCIGYIICVEVKPGFFCVAGVWMIQFWLGITNWLITCVALNLQLVLVHLCNGIVLEKYYLIGTLVLNLGTTLPPLIKGKFGWDDVIGVCWLTSYDNTDRLIWQISTQLLWILLAVFITCICCLTTIYHLYRHKFNALSILAHKPQTATTDSMRSASPDNRASANYSPSKGAQRSLLSSQEFRSIILRISLYPAVMIVLNLVITIADIRISILSGIYSQGDYALYALYYALYGARGIFYAFIAVMDPSLQRAYHVWRGERVQNSTANGTALGNGTYNDPNDPEIGDLALASESKQPEYGNVINVQTEITSHVQEHPADIDSKFHGDIPMTTLANPHNITMTKTVIESNNQMKENPLGHTFFDSRHSLEMPAPTLKHPSSREDIKRVTHWTDLRSDYEASMIDLPDDSSSEVGLAAPGYLGGSKSSDSLDYMKADVEGIRLRQRARAQQRRLLEKEMKRQI